MSILKPDSSYELGGVKVNEYLLTRHNPNNIDMPTANMNDILGVTIHNTEWITTAEGTTPAEQYTRSTVNGNMKDVRVHFYVDDKCAWQNLPLDLSGWHAADGDGDGNRRTIAVECIMSGEYNDTDKRSEDNAARICAALLDKYSLSTENLYTHTYWFNKSDGRTGSVDKLDVLKNTHKTCPIYIIPHWASFVDKVRNYMKSSVNTVKLYRIRKSWDDAASQTGAYSDLENAKKACKSGYTVYDNSGNAVYSPDEKAVSSSEKNVTAEVRQLQNGMSGTDVSALQAVLIQKGYNCGTYGADGKFGKDTENAVRRFQKDKKLDVDGISGKQTWTALLS